MFVTQPHPPIIELAIVTALNWQPLVQTEKNTSLLEMVGAERADGGGAWVHPKGENSVVIYGLSLRNIMVDTE